MSIFRASPVQLKIKPIAIDTFRENVLILSRDCRALRPERLKGSRKVEINAGGERILASVVIAEDPLLVSADEAGLTQPAFRRLGALAGALVDVAPAPPPLATSAIFDKIRGDTLTAAQLSDVVHDLVDHRWSDMEIAAFLVACASFMTADETLALTDAMARAGKRLDWNNRLVVDKHCIGGVPGNRTSLIVAPIVAAHGLLFPKTSSRAITSPAGTADTMEVLARVDLDEDEMRAVVERCGGCVVWGGRVDLSPADDVLISVERPLSIDTPDQMVASILSKKIAAGSTSLIIDVPVGPSAKVRDTRAALRLRKLFEFVGSRLGLHVDVVMTDGSQPIGRGIGPALEMRDVQAVLRGAKDAPAELLEKSIRLAGRLLELDPEVRGGQGETRARELLTSGAAMKKMEQIAEAQGPSPISNALGALVHEVAAPADGWIEGIDCLRIARIARLAGAPTDAGAGIDILKRKGDNVRAGEPLYRLHGVECTDFDYAASAADAECGFHIS
ncbi:MAG: thymidine phosphorylase [Caulobacteraceae bacterium]|nr:MAG: thymidine phosphorylase [Caulobacteraceae bacterium]